MLLKFVFEYILIDCFRDHEKSKMDERLTQKLREDALKSISVSVRISEMPSFDIRFVQSKSDDRAVQFLRKVG